MKKNIGLIDKILRTIVAFVFIIMYLTNTVQGVLGIVFIILALIFLVTSLFSACPIYVPFKISTKNKSEKS